MNIYELEEKLKSANVPKNCYSIMKGDIIKEEDVPEIESYEQLPLFDKLETIQSRENKEKAQISRRVLRQKTVIGRSGGIKPENRSVYELFD